MKRLKESDTDILHLVGSVALDAAGAGAAVPIWDAMFPSDEPSFTESQLEQLAQLFSTLLQKQDFNRDKSDYETLKEWVDVYMASPTSELLNSILTTSSQTAGRIQLNGYSSAQIYLSCSALYLLALKLVWASDQPNNQPAQAALIASTAVSLLNDLAVFEADYAAVTGMANFAQFKQATLLNQGSMPADAQEAFGAGYADMCNSLIALVKQWGPDQLSKIPTPALMLWWLDPNVANVQCFWDSENDAHSIGTYGVSFWKCADQVGSTYPLGDFVTLDVQPIDGGGGCQWAQGMQVPYVQILDGNRVKTTSSFSQVWYDHGTGNPGACSIWTPALPQVGNFGYVSAYTGTGAGPGGWSSPEVGLLYDNELIEQVPAYQFWNDTHTGAVSDVVIYVLPSFGYGSGVGSGGPFYAINSEDPWPTIPALKSSAFTGFIVKP